MINKEPDLSKLSRDRWHTMPTIMYLATFFSYTSSPIFGELIEKHDELGWSN
jgi:hypothetical protein